MDLVMCLVSIGLLAVLAGFVWAMEKLLMSTSQGIGLVVAVVLFVYFVARWSGRRGSDADHDRVRPLLRLADRRRVVPRRRGCSASTTAGPASSGASSARSSASPIASWGSIRRRSRPGASTRAACCCSRAPASALLYALQRLQGHLPLNPAGLKGVRPDIAFNTAWSFVTNTNWQNYGGETTMSYLTQMAGLAVQNFVSAAVGIAVAVALIRGFAPLGLGDDRQLLGRSRPRLPLPPAAARVRARGRPRLARRRPDVRRPGHGAHARGRRRR